MASLKYLWRNRFKASAGSGGFFRVWGKRLLSLSELVKRNQHRKYLIKKGAMIDETAEISQIIFEGNGKLLSIGACSFVGRVNIALHDEVIIGQRVCINDGVRIFTASHDVLDPIWANTTAKVVIEDYVWIGTGAMILPGLRLGRGSVVGAGSVVSKSVAPGSIVVGNPAKPTSKQRFEKLNYNPCEFLAANRAWLIK